MIFDEKEIYELGREKRVTFPLKKKAPEKKPSDIATLAPAFSHIFNLFDSVKQGLSKLMTGFNSIDKKMEVVIKAVNKKPEPKPKKSDKWDFKIIRNIDNQIQKIEATRKE
jgi:hypothetical protein